jgi:hypothetical protein
MEQVRYGATCTHPMLADGRMAGTGHAVRRRQRRKGAPLQTLPCVHHAGPWGNGAPSACSRVHVPMQGVPARRWGLGRRGRGKRTTATPVGHGASRTAHAGRGGVTMSRTGTRRTACRRRGTGFLFWVKGKGSGGREVRIVPSCVVLSAWQRRLCVLKDYLPFPFTGVFSRANARMCASTH